MLKNIYFSIKRDPIEWVLVDEHDEDDNSQQNRHQQQPQQQLDNSQHHQQSQQPQSLARPRPVSKLATWFPVSLLGIPPPPPETTVPNVDGGGVIVVNGQQKEEGERNVSSATTVEDDTKMHNSGYTSEPAYIPDTPIDTPTATPVSLLATPLQPPEMAMPNNEDHEGLLS